MNFWAKIKKWLNYSVKAMAKAYHPVFSDKEIEEILKDYLHV
jgi:hypothetical protein